MCGASVECTFLFWKLSCFMNLTNYKLEAFKGYSDILNIWMLIIVLLRILMAFKENLRHSWKVLSHGLTFDF